MLKTLFFLAPMLALGSPGSRSGLGWRRDDKEDSMYRRRAMQQIIKVGDYVYLHGGEISTFINGDQKESLGSSQLISTLSISLKESWDNSTVQFSTIKQDRPRNVNMKHALWSEDRNDKFYRWGGAAWREDEMKEEDVVLFDFTIDDVGGGGKWNESTPANPDVFDELIGNSNGASASCAGMGFYIGGLASINTDPRMKDVDHKDPWPATPGILTYHFESRKWSNDSTAPLNEPSGAVANMEGHCTRAFNDKKPLIFALGGVRTEPESYDSNELIGMNNITFWNPNEKQWHFQEATGDVPRGREFFCAVGAQSTSGTYEIFIYGGANDIDGTENSIHVLTLPGFRWFEVEVDSPTRMHHTCTVIGKRQMLSVGGVTSEWDWEGEDPWRYAMGVFDMTDLEWKSRYDSDADEYESPQMVRDWYDNGGMDEVNWSGDDIKQIFAKDIDGGSSSGSGSGSGGDGDSDGDSSNSGSNTGAIAGGVVGGVAGIALISALIWFFLRRRRSADGSKPAELSGGQVPQYKPEPGYSENSTSPQPGSHSSVSPAFMQGHSPSNGNPSAYPGPAAYGQPNSAYPQSAYQQPAYPQQTYPIEMPTHGHETVEMPTGTERVEMPQEGHTRVEMNG